MIPDQSFPPVDYLPILRRYLQAAGEQPIDVISLLNPNVEVGTPDDLISFFNRQTGSIDPSQIYDALANRGRRRAVDFVLPEDYTGVFRVPGLQRRVEREKPVLDADELPEDVKEHLGDWFAIISEDMVDGPDVESINTPGDMEPFSRLLGSHMPERLDADSWIGRELLQLMDLETAYDLADYGTFTPWNSGMIKSEFKTDRSGIMSPVSYLDHLFFCNRAVPIGDTGPGRLVFQPRPNITSRAQVLMIKNELNIQNAIAEYHSVLISLSRRFARVITERIVHWYLVPNGTQQGRTLMTRKQIAQAVREILGEKWLELPFDDEGWMMSGWSEDDVLKSDAEMLEDGCQSPMLGEV